MRWILTAPMLLVALALVGGRALHLRHLPHHEGADHVHSHGHWHDGEYHEHHHSHDEPMTEPLEDHADDPHEHGWTNAPNEEPGTSTLVAAPVRRDHWNPPPAIAARAVTTIAEWSNLDQPPTTPPPRLRAGPEQRLIALRSIRLQV